MTDHEWDTSNDPLAMIRFVADYERADWLGRKLRLFAAACCRAVWNQMPDFRSREAVELAESAVAHEIAPCRFASARRSADLVWRRWDYGGYGWPYWRSESTPENESAARAASACVDPVGPIRAATETVTALQSMLSSRYAADLLREIVGNPFHGPVGRRWWSSDVRGIARAIEWDRAFERLPILGDALMDAGCENEQVIRHCQSAGPHVLGCWALDFAFGRV